MLLLALGIVGSSLPTAAKSTAFERRLNPRGGQLAYSQAREHELGAVVAPVRLVPTTSQPIAVEGLHRYFGTIELKSAGDGIVVVNRLSLERYLLGLQEVPTHWPMEALRAQAVAARTYALRTLEKGHAGAAAVYGFDICASVECQVFSGADVALSEDGNRWIEAVTTTDGEAVLHDGAPILARYHSTSGGHTLENRSVFTEERSYPYLRPVSSTTEQASPLYRWRVVFPLRRLQAMLASVGSWSEGRLKEVHTIPSRTGLHYADVVLKGRRGRVLMSAEELREILRDLAPEFYPDAYPSRWPTASGFLPETLPSNRFEVATRRRSAIVRGRGWGHGVGMSQYGAYGLAQQGALYTDILTHYYTGVTVDQWPDPGPISVGVDWAASEVVIGGAFRLEDGRGATIVDEAVGDWSFDWSGSGVISIDPPFGYRLPLRVGIVRAPRRVDPGEKAAVVVALSKPAKISTLTDGAPDESLSVGGAGRRRIEWRAPDAPGTYSVVVEASIGDRSKRTRPVEIEVVAAPEEQEPERGEGALQSSPRWPLLVLGIALLGLGGAMAIGKIKR